MTSGTSQPRSFTSLTEVGSHCNVCVVFIHLRYCAKITNFCTFALPKVENLGDRRASLGIFRCFWRYEKSKYYQSGVFEESGRYRNAVETTGSSRLWYWNRCRKFGCRGGYCEYLWIYRGCERRIGKYHFGTSGTEERRDCRTSICDRLFITTLWSRTSRRNSRGWCFFR